MNDPGCSLGVLLGAVRPLRWPLAPRGTSILLIGGGLACVSTGSDGLIWEWHRGYLQRSRPPGLHWLAAKPSYDPSLLQELLGDKLVQVLARAGLASGDVSAPFCNWLLGHEPGASTPGRCAELARLRQQALSAYPLLPFIWSVACETRFRLLHPASLRSSLPLPPVTAFESAVDARQSPLDGLVEATGLPQWLCRRLAGLRLDQLCMRGTASLRQHDRRDVARVLRVLAEAGPAKFPDGRGWAHLGAAMDLERSCRGSVRAAFFATSSPLGFASVPLGASQRFKLDDVLADIQANLAEPLAYAASGLFEAGRRPVPSLPAVRTALETVLLGGRTAFQIADLATGWHRRFGAIQASLAEAYPTRASLRGWGKLCGPVQTADGWSVHVVGDERELGAEGKELRHCATIYAQRCLDGGCIILSIRDPAGRRVSTAELALIRQPIGRRHKRSATMLIQQHSTFRNAVPPAAAGRALVQWMNAVSSGHVRTDLELYDHVRMQHAREWDRCPRWDSHLDIRWARRPSYCPLTPEARQAAWEQYAPLLPPAVRRAGIAAFTARMLPSGQDRREPGIQGDLRSGSWPSGWHGLFRPEAPVSKLAALETSTSLLETGAAARSPAPPVDCLP